MIEVNKMWYRLVKKCGQVCNKEKINTLRLMAILITLEEAKTNISKQKLLNFLLFEK